MYSLEHTWMKVSELSFTLYKVIIKSSVLLFTTAINTGTTLNYVFVRTYKSIKIIQRLMLRLNGGHYSYFKCKGNMISFRSLFSRKYLKNTPHRHHTTKKRQFVHQNNKFSTRYWNLYLITSEFRRFLL